MRADNSHHVIAAARHRSRATTRQGHHSPTQHSTMQAHTINFDVVAREAKVSRSWLYNQPDLRAEIERLRSRQRPVTRSFPTGNAPPTRPCVNDCRSPPTASATSKPTTLASATHSPKPSANDELTPAATRRHNSIPTDADHPE